MDEQKLTAEEINDMHNPDVGWVSDEYRAIWTDRVQKYERCSADVKKKKWGPAVVTALWRASKCKCHSY